MIDKDGYRANVGMILCNSKGQLLWARRIGQDAWQFPQGGIRQNEEMEEALFRELAEEIGLDCDQVQVLGRTRDWLKYRLPDHLVRRESVPVCYGQKQIWYLLMLKTGEDKIRLDQSDKPEFDNWKWVDYWHPLKEVVSFKRAVYKQALKELKGYLDSVKTPDLSTSG